MTAKLLIGLIRGYQLTLSPFLGGSCRFLPTCSAYAIEAVATHGAWRGTGLALRRLARCHPLGKSGFDPVPVAPPAFAKTLRRGGPAFAKTLRRGRPAFAKTLRRGTPAFANRHASAGQAPVAPRTSHLAPRNN